MLRLGWFSTGRGEGSRGLFSRVQEDILSGNIDAKIEFVFCNRERGEYEGSDRFIELVESYSIPIVTYSFKHFYSDYGIRISENRSAFDHEILGRIRQFKPDLCVLAGYMLITGADLCTQYNMLNIHPALPDGPIGTWQQIIWELIRNRDSKTGAVVFHVTKNLDEGPRITYCSFPINGKGYESSWQQIDKQSVLELQKKHGESLPLFQLIRQAGIKREQPLLTQTLAAFSNGKIKFKSGKLVDKKDKPLIPLCLTSEVERSLSY
jgi:folate-dependent phosphoribosylglycinamide formyltransferase PurN